jgi:cysteinyl-tRNA synthetase
MRLYDTMARAVVDVHPEGDTLSMYSCGPTVYRDAHVGNLRTFLVADLIRRVARMQGLPVRQVQNITDVGHMTDELFGEGGRDRIELAAELEGRTAPEIAALYTERFLADIDAIGIERADAYPRASDHIPQMIALIEQLIARGHAYEVGGAVYYDTTSFPAYGKLSGNTLDALEADHRKVIGDTSKKHASDFILWMPAGPARVARFDSPWGEGYPGWHIECSAMSIEAFGERIDIHTGGEDNVFPHHEDEIAQSEGALGHDVVRHWVHGAHLLMDGHKMSKSSRNDVTLSQLAERGHHDARAVRLLFLQSRYRGQMNLTTDALSGAERALGRWRRAADRWRRAGGSPDPARMRPFDDRFAGAVADDLDTPSAIALVAEIGNADALSDADRLALATRWDAVLGLQLTAVLPTVDVPAEVRALAEQRAAARAARDFAAADGLRARILEAGFEVLDTADGSEIRAR